MTVTRASVPEALIIRETMKSVLLYASLLLSTSVSGIAQTSSPPVGTSANFSVSGNDSAMIILPAGTQSLTPAETTTLRSAMFNVYQAIPDIVTARKVLLQTSAGIAASHGAPSTGPYNITGDFSVQISVVPPHAAQAADAATVWKKVASAGQSVIIKAGTTVRFGAPVGAPPNDASVQAPLATNSFAPQVTYQADTVITIAPAAFGGVDPAPNYVKELDMLGTTGGVSVANGR